MKYLYIIFSIIISTSRCGKGCSDEPTKCNGFVPYPQMMKDYFLFQDSSYWIYQDSISDVIDSFWVTDFSKYENIWPHEIIGNKNTPCYEVMTYNLKRLIKPNYIEKIQFSASFKKKGFEDLTNFYTFHTLSYSGINYKFQERFISFRRDSLQNFSYHEDGQIFKIKTFNLKSKIYENVLFLNYPLSSYEDWVKRIYYAKHIGVIKFEDEDGRIWELVRYNVKQ